MQVSCTWQETLHFAGEAGPHHVEIDAKAPLGGDAGLNPKELLALAVCSCTAMDVASLMRKFKQTMDSFEVAAVATMSKGEHPIVFNSLALTFRVAGVVDGDKLLEAVQLSQTKYCGISAMVSKAVEINYRVELNGMEIGKGEASFVR